MNHIYITKLKTMQYDINEMYDEIKKMRDKIWGIRYEMDRIVDDMIADDLMDDKYADEKEKEMMMEHRLESLQNQAQKYGEERNESPTM